MRTLLILTLCVVGSPTLAGNLEPPVGLPGETLEQLIQTGDLPLTITAAGTWMLAEDIVTTGNGITIDADNVTLDLAGFRLGGGSGDGIHGVAGRKNLEVRNGLVTGWGDNGIDFSGVDGARIEGVRVIDNQAHGIELGTAGVVVGSLARTNLGDGIRGGRGTSMSRCVSHSNAGMGLVVGSGSSISDSTATQNTLGGIASGVGSTLTFVNASRNSSTGIQLGSGSVVVDSTAGFNALHGIVGSDGARIERNVTVDNADAGILVTSGTLVRDNLSVSNGTPSGGSGVHVTGSGNRIESNNVTENIVGLEVDATGNVIIGNTAHHNVLFDFSITAGNSLGQILDVTVGPTTIVTLNSWANWRY